MTRTGGSLALSGIAVVAAFAAACADHALDLESPEATILQQGQLAKPEEVRALDALVDDINGFGSLDDFRAHPARFSDELDERFSETLCPFTEKSESAARVVTRSREDGRLRKLVRSWTSTQEKSSVRTHEAYHYDDRGTLRVVIVDQETDHSLDADFMRLVDLHNEEVTLAIGGMPTTTEAERIAIVQKGHELRDATTVSQFRVYFRVDGTTFYETRRDALELARADSFPDIPQDPPTLYGKVHPANVTALPYLLSLSPKPRYSARALPEILVRETQLSVVSELLGAGEDGEIALMTRPVCR